MAHWQGKGLEPEIVLDTHNIHILLRLIDMGMRAACIIPDSEISKELLQRHAVRQVTDPDLIMQPVLISKKGRYASPRVRAVAEFIVRTAFEGDGRETL